MKHLIRLKKIINLAIKLEWMAKSPFGSYKIKIQHDDLEYLTAGELSAMEKKVFSLYRLELVSGLFVFCCYTGLAYINAMNLNPDKLITGMDGET